MEYVKNALILAFVGVLLLFTIGPILIMISTSLKPSEDILSQDFQLFFIPTFQNYSEVFLRGPYAHYLMNSIIIGICSTVLALILGTMAAYAVARFRLGGNQTALAIFIVRMIPPVAIMTTLFLLVRNIGGSDTYWAVILLHTAFNLPFVLWLMLGFFRELPVEIEEAASLDGCNRLQVFALVAVPLVRGGLIAAGIFCLLSSWNEFPFAFISTGSRTQTLTVAALSFRSDEGIHYGHVTAFGSGAILPVMVAALIFQRRLISALTGAVKG